MKPLRIYPDTSVFGGCFDDEFSEYSLKFFEKVRIKEIRLVLSVSILEELKKAPEQVRGILGNLPQEMIEYSKETSETLFLRDAYIKAGVVTISSIFDATHVAQASISSVDAIVSWNFKDIVQLKKIRGFRGVNVINGYPMIQILSPREVLEP